MLNSAINISNVYLAKHVNTRTDNDKEEETDEDRTSRVTRALLSL